ncbi:GNAT family N-acyltransferase [Balneolaceae bacterium ANBcel3]|nr:GNAT family N-acyltransferase [Balneolaceae bacterium ANBcel3]
MAKIFTFDKEIEQSGNRLLFRLAQRPLERILAFKRLNRLYNDALEYETDQAYYDRLLDRMNISYLISDQDLQRIPKDGRLVVVANHPFGGIEGVMLASLLRSVRKDSKIMANYMLEKIPELREVFFFVDPFGGAASARANIATIKKSLEWLNNDHLLGVFPAGEVAHFSKKKQRIVEPQWSESIASLIRRTNAPVLPVYFSGHNRFLFQMVGAIHPRLRTMMLPREFLNKQDKDFEVRIGNIITPKKITSIEDNKELANFLRQRTIMLQNRSSEDARTVQVPVASAAQEDIIDPVPVDELKGEIDSLAKSQCLLQSGEFEVYHAVKKQVPLITREIGRLREVTFRGTNEGTGKAIDLDRFDEYYVHLFVWNREKEELVGAYRIGRTDNLIKRFGKRGLYTTTLFRIRSAFFDKISPALEMGRSFIRPEYQRSFAPLMLLWKGIGHYVVKYPDYKILFGPVSISSDYSSLSRHLIVTFLKLNNYLPDMARMVRPKMPYKGHRVRGMDTRNKNVIRSLEDVSDLMTEFEGEKKSVPILLKQYLKLGGKLLGFNVDPDFSDVLDGLILVDLTKTDPKILKRYMGDEGIAFFTDYHAKKKEEQPGD